MEAACLRILSWLERSGYVPESALEEIERAKENVGDSIRDFHEGAGQLLETDSEDPKTFAIRLMMIEGLAQSLRNDIQDIEEALRKALVSLPEGIFDDESTPNHRTGE